MREEVDCESALKFDSTPDAQQAIESLSLSSLLHSFEKTIDFNVLRSNVMGSKFKADSQCPGSTAHVIELAR